MPLVAHRSLRNAAGANKQSVTSGPSGTAEMLARAAIIGRVTRERSEARRVSNVTTPEKRQRSKSSSTLDFDPPLITKRVFIPCSKGAVISVVLSTILLAIGAVMCNFAFHATYYATETVTTNNSTMTYTNIPTYMGLRSMTYIGPTFMGIGAFLIIVCCVVVFDTRERIIKEALQKEVQKQQQISQEYALKHVLGRGASKTVKSRQGTGGQLKSDVKCGEVKYHSCSVSSLDQVMDTTNTCTCTSDECACQRQPPATVSTAVVSPTASVEPLSCEEANIVSITGVSKLLVLNELQRPSAQPSESEAKHTSKTSIAASSIFDQVMKLNSMRCSDEGPIITQLNKVKRPDTALQSDRQCLQSSCRENPAYEASNYDLKSCLLDNSTGPQLLFEVCLDDKHSPPSPLVRPIKRPGRLPLATQESDDSNLVSPNYVNSSSCDDTRLLYSISKGEDQLSSDTYV